MTLEGISVAALIGGVLFILLARWARRKNAALSDQISAWEVSKKGVSFKYLLFGSRSSIESGIGRTLAGIGIVVVIAFVAFAIYLVIDSAR